MISNIPINHVSGKQMKEVCKIGTAECCRYLTVGADGFGCEKKSSLKALLDSKVARGEMRAVGDNCPGLPG